MPLCSGETPAAELPQPWAQHRQDLELLQEPRGGSRMSRGMEQLCWEERLGELGLFTWTGEALG